MTNRSGRLAMDPPIGPQASRTSPNLRGVRKTEAGLSLSATDPRNSLACRQLTGLDLRACSNPEFNLSDRMARPLS